MDGEVLVKITERGFNIKALWIIEKNSTYIYIYIQSVNGGHLCLKTNLAPQNLLRQKAKSKMEFVSFEYTILLLQDW